jgi:hypothetical protein
LTRWSGTQPHTCGQGALLILCSRSLGNLRSPGNSCSSTLVATTLL